MCLPVSRLFWVSSLAYPNLLRTKGYVVVVVVCSQLVPLLDNILDFGTYGATLSVARSFQAAGYDHLKRLGHINHTFPSVEDVQGVVEDRSCKNLCARFLKKFWMEGGGRALAFGEAACRVPQLGVPKLGPKPTTNQAPDQPFKGKKSTEEDP
jgi:hypothetical protein